jgi:hypothetical protein
MANQKISQMTQYSGNLDSTAIFPTVFSGQNYQVSAGNIANLAVSSITTLSITGDITTGGNVSGGNITTAGIISATGGLTANTLLINSSANILGNLNVQGNITYIDSNVIVTNDLFVELANNQSTYTNINGAGLAAGNSAGAPLTTWTYRSTANAWGTNVNVSVTGNVTASKYIGNGAALTNIVGANVTGTVANATTSATVTASAQPNIASVGTSLTIGTWTIKVGGGGNLVFSVGSSNVMSIDTGGNVSAALNVTAYANVANIS